jgi:uncharacterized protein YcfJ
MRNRLVTTALLAALGVSAMAGPALAEKKKVLVCHDVKKSNNKGTAIGAVAGGVLGNVVAGHGSKTAGTLLGAGGGAVVGHEVARKNNDKNPDRDCHYEYR